MVFVRHTGQVHPIMVGPLSTAGMASWGKGAEIVWIQFKLGTFMPHLPLRDHLDGERLLPKTASQSFWLKGSAWQFPNYENVDTFVNRLVRDELLVRDPVVDAALKDEPQDIASRTVRHRFLQATGITQSHIRQIERAQYAKSLLAAGKSILDTVEAAGYFDQPHLTRALKQWVGHTPAQIIRMSQSACHFIQDTDLLPDYDTNVLAAVGQHERRNP